MVDETVFALISRRPTQIAWSLPAGKGVNNDICKTWSAFVRLRVSAAYIRVGDVVPTLSDTLAHSLYAPFGVVMTAILYEAITR